MPRPRQQAMTNTAPLEHFTLGQTLQVPRLWTGLWQLSSNAWGTASAASIRAAMAKHVERGYNTFGEEYLGVSTVL